MKRRTALTLLLWGCTPLGETPTGDTGTTGPVTYAPTWDGMQELFVDHCDSCHPAQNELELRTALPEDIALATGLYVVPGDPSTSDIWEAVAGTSISLMMPPTGRLPRETVQHVEDWILDGAPTE